MNKSYTQKLYCEKPCSKINTIQCIGCNNLKVEIKEIKIKNRIDSGWGEYIPLVKIKGDNK